VRDAPVDLRQALIDAMLKIPVANSVTDRRLLIMLIRRDVSSFPDVEERPEARQHILRLVLACLEQPASLPALRAALTVMAPEDAGTRRVRQLIDSATLAGLVPEGELRRVRELLQRASGPPDRWRALLKQLALDPSSVPADLVRMFDQLAAQEPGLQSRPPALVLVKRIADAVHPPLDAELTEWVAAQAERLDVSVDSLLADRSDQAHGAEPGGDPADEQAHPDGGFARLGGGESEIPDSQGVIVDETDMLDLNLIGAAGPPLSLGEDEDESGDAMASVAYGRRTGKRLPQVWGDIPQRNPHFTGRKALLDRMHNQLQDSRTTAVLPQALHGMGGVGKSQIAIEYVHRHSDEYDLVWWIPSEQSGQILTSLTKLAQRLLSTSVPKQTTRCRPSARR